MGTSSFETFLRDNGDAIRKAGEAVNAHALKVGDTAPDFVLQGVCVCVCVLCVVCARTVVCWCWVGDVSMSGARAMLCFCPCLRAPIGVGWVWGSTERK